ncbi:MAG TPA: SCO family protein [Hypericibacter adhaerens]|jgi:protein SCO1/2|uniref:SCO family protein n=1 Tax=Hypericibacter adhaerens TaxID=2602016 RepID=UPI002BCE2970|nr:SCO family protein [Hypericibacter adhaerens]HWA46215.1 SCO family protein [Hypericibacter adhaerens]
MKRGFLYAGLVIAAAVFVASTAVLLLEWRARETGTPGMTTAADIGGPFSLTDQDGKKVTDADYAGQWKLVFFGFTYCPDICPTTLSRISLTLKALGPLGDKLHPLFITIDPERDTPEILKSYIDAFDKRITGLTGTPDEIAAVAKEYRAFYEKVPQGDTYTMNHSTVIYVMRPDGRYETLLRYDDTPDEMAAKLKPLLQQG